MGATPQLTFTPLFQQVRDHLAQQIAAGTWAVGAIMPPESELARSYGVSIGTVQKALSVMEREQLVSRIQGRGTFVKSATPAHVCPTCGRAMTNGAEVEP